MHMDDRWLILISQNGSFGMPYDRVASAAGAAQAVGAVEPVGFVMPPACRLALGHCGEGGPVRVFWINEKGGIVTSLPFPSEAEARRYVRERNPALRWEFTIDGAAFDDLEGFYLEMERMFTRGPAQKMGHNLDAFNDLLRGGFGRHGYEEPIAIRWINHEKSKKDLGYAATGAHYERMLKNCHSAQRERILQLRDAALAGQGKTLLDRIEATILDGEDSGHNCTLEAFSGAAGNHEVAIHSWGGRW